MCSLKARKVCFTTARSVAEGRARSEMRSSTSTVITSSSPSPSSSAALAFFLALAPLFAAPSPARVASIRLQHSSSSCSTCTRRPPSAPTRRRNTA
eukprot:1919925-Rhodomonas_salina.1